MKGGPEKRRQAEHTVFARQTITSTKEPTSAKASEGTPPPAETKQNEKPRGGKFGSFISLGLSLYITSPLSVVV